MNLSTVVASSLGAGAVIAWRLRETTRPVTLKSIVIPPLGMSTGFAMFLVPQTRIPLTWALAAFLTGALVLAVPMIMTTKLERVGDTIMMRRSRAFLVIFLLLIAVRFAARRYVEQYIDVLQTGSLFFVLAFGMILHWRLRVLLDYRKLTGTNQ